MSQACGFLLKRVLGVKTAPESESFPKPTDHVIGGGSTIRHNFLYSEPHATACEFQCLRKSTRQASKGNTGRTQAETSLTGLTRSYALDIIAAAGCTEQEAKPKAYMTKIPSKYSREHADHF